MTEFLNPQQLIKEISIKPGITAADFGCGSGNITILLAQTIGSEGKVYALDVLQTALQTVESKAKAQGLHNIFTIRANLEIANSSTLKDESVDLVLLANILFQSPKQQAIIQEAERILKQDGCLIIIDWKKTKTPYQTSPEKIKQMVSLEFDREIPVGKYHFGLVFKKP